MSLERVPGPPPPNALATHTDGSLVNAPRTAFFSLKRRTPLGVRGVSARLADVESLMTTFKWISVEFGTEQGLESEERSKHSPEGAMKFSEAIRLGAMMTPQVFRTPLTDDGACALGAALLAVGARPEEAVRSALSRWPWASAVSADCPGCGRSRTVFMVITHLNDRHRWTREQIAKWVAGIEPTDVFWRPSEPTQRRKNRCPSS